MKVNPELISWLVDKENTGISYPVLKNLTGLKTDDKHVVRARKKAYSVGAIGRILDRMHPDGYWVKPGAGYNPKYKSTVWSLILLSQLGASASDDIRIAKACKYYLDHAVSRDNSISYNGTPSGVIDCLQGNMCLALNLMGYKDERLPQVYDWMARSVSGDGVKYYAYKCGPEFACGANGKLPCAWGAVKVVLALSGLPEKRKTPVIRKTIRRGAEFLLAGNPLKAGYPTRTGSPPSRNWWKFGFPVFYITDLLQNVEALVAAGYARDNRLQSAIEYIVSRQDKKGRYTMDYDYTGKTWQNFGVKNQPNKWVTYRAWKVLRDIN